MLCKQDNMSSIREQRIIMDNYNKFTEAMYRGNCEVIDTMLSQGYVPNTNSIATPCKNGNVDVLTRLLKYPMDVNDGFLIALNNKQSHLLDQLIHAGADIYYQDDEGNNALHNVRDIDTCKWLMNMGIKQIPNKNGRTPLLEACCRGNRKLACLLLSYPGGTESIDQCDDEGQFPLYSACISGSLKLVDTLLSYPQGVKTIGYGRLGATPLSVACINSNDHIVQRLLNYPQGVESINKPDEAGCVPLYYPCYTGCKDTVEMMLTHPLTKETVNTPDMYGDSPFIIARKRGHKDIVELLTPYTSKINSSN